MATVQPSHPDNWKWRNDKSLSKLDASHRKAGWWAVDTNNPNSWQTGGSAYVAESTADVILTQEVKIAEGYPQEAAEQAARTAKWKVSIEPCLITAAGGKSAGTAVATRSYIGMSTPKAVATSQHLHPQGHLAIRRVAAMGRGGVHIGSIYCFSEANEGGIHSESNLGLLKSAAFTINSLVGPWIVGGDWNCTPADLTKTGWLDKVGGVIHAPSSPTCNGKIYDFFVVAKSISDQVQSTHLIADAGFTPHSPARLIFRGLPRKTMVRRLNAPSPIPAVLPTDRCRSSQRRLTWSRS